MSQSRRTAKVAEAIREVVATSVLFGLRDPRVANVTILSVEAAGDLRTAKVFVSVMGDDKKQRLCMHGLDSSRGFLQRKIADQLDLRYTPVLTFVLDQGIKKSISAGQILRQIAEERAAAEAMNFTDSEQATTAALDDQAEAADGTAIPACSESLADGAGTIGGVADRGVAGEDALQQDRSVADSGDVIDDLNPDAAASSG